MTASERLDDQGAAEAGDRVPGSADVVVIGGGAIGCSTAYHLAKHGRKSVVLVEQHTLSAGTTWHAAGAVAQYRPNPNLMELARYSVNFYPELERETGLSTGLRQTGGMRVASTRERRREYERTITAARSFGLEMELISPREVKDLFPLLEVDDLDSALYIPTDGVVGPSDVTQSLARGARMHGAELYQHVTVTGFTTENGRVTGVLTSAGSIRSGAVAICAGIWSRQLGRLAGVDIPIWPSRHCYFITEPIEDLDPNWPTARDPDLWHYLVPQATGLMVGQYEPDPVGWETATIPRGWSFKLLAPDLPHFTRLQDPLLRRIPALEAAGVHKWYHGLESFTEDQNPVVGPTPGAMGLFVAAGFNAYGVSVAGGFGMALADWIANGEPPFDLWPSDARRFSSLHRSDLNVSRRAIAGQGRHYTIHWPYEEIEAGRPLRRSPVHDRLATRRAVFGEKNGWERANWFAPEGVEPVDRFSFEQFNWFEHVAAEHRACRDKVALFDISSFSKARFVGRDAEAILQRTCSADLGLPVGRVAHTFVLNGRGGIEADMTVARLGEDDFFIITGSAFATHDFGIIRGAIQPSEHASLVDVTSGFAALAIMGPRSRELLQTLTETDISAEAFPFRAVRHVIIAGAPAVALRISYVGELGFELYIPSEYALTVYEAIAKEGLDFGLRHAGYRAIDSLRLEKGNKAWSIDITPDYTPLEADVMYAVAFDKNAEFRGRSALLRQREGPMTKRLAYFTTETSTSLLLGRETIYRDGIAVGWLTSGGFGHTLEAGVGLGYVRREEGVPDEYVKSGSWELEVAAERIPARAQLSPLFDPTGERMRR